MLRNVIGASQAPVAGGFILIVLVRTRLGLGQMNPARLLLRGYHHLLHLHPQLVPVGLAGTPCPFVCVSRAASYHDFSNTQMGRVQTALNWDMGPYP